MPSASMASRLTIMTGVDECRNQIAELEKLGISMDMVTAELEAEGVKSFADAFTALLQTVDERRAAVVAGLGPSGARRFTGA